jgi:hypothetical protein
VLGKALQVEPMLKALGTHCLNLNYDTLRSCFGFNFNLRRYSLGYRVTRTRIVGLIALLLVTAFVFASLVTNLLPSPPPKAVVDSG